MLLTIRTITISLQYKATLVYCISRYISLLYSNNHYVVLLILLHCIVLSAERLCKVKEKGKSCV